MAIRRDITEGFCLPQYSYLRPRQNVNKTLAKGEQKVKEEYRLALIKNKEACTVTDASLFFL